MQTVIDSGLILLGCGRMGTAMLKGWLAAGVPPEKVRVIEPYPSDWLRASGVVLDGPPPSGPAAIILAVKPQVMVEALDGQSFGGSDTLILSIAAGTPLNLFEHHFGAATPIVRAMPNTPAAIGQGITALIGNGAAKATDLALAEALMAAVGQTVRLETEAQMDAVTALSGSGPAYIFHLIEAMAAAGEAEGLPADLATKLARATVVGAAALAGADPTPAAGLREAVTSPGGTTAAALAVLMDGADGLPPLMARAIKAAADRSRELGNE